MSQIANHTAHASPIGITMGDAAGIGPEIIVRMLAAGLPHRAVIYGDAGTLQAAAVQLGFHRQLALHAYSDMASAIADSSLHAESSGVVRVAVLSRREALPPDLMPGQLSAIAGRAAYDYLCHAIDDAQAGYLRGIVTAPLNKAAMQAGGIDFPGHTEILADRTGTSDYAMMLANEELRVILVTIHVALANVPSQITHDSELRTIRLAHLACRQAGIARPRIAVAGLNPHAGEDGKFGREDVDIIAPAIAQAREEGMNVTGPWPGDTIFMRARRGEFDIVVAQYHDQGLIPVKYLGVDHGVNVTIGLPFIRTSVDHGTAFDIAGQGIADPSSLRTAFDLALSMSVAPSSSTD